MLTQCLDHAQQRLSENLREDALQEPFNYCLLATQQRVDASSPSRWSVRSPSGCHQARKRPTTYANGPVVKVPLHSTDAAR